MWGEELNSTNLKVPSLSYLLTSGMLILMHILLLQLTKATVLAESSWSLCFHCDLLHISTDISQVGVVLSSPFLPIFLSCLVPDFPFILIRRTHLLYTFEHHALQHTGWIHLNNKLVNSKNDCMKTTIHYLSLMLLKINRYTVLTRSEKRKCQRQRSACIRENLRHFLFDFIQY